MGHELLMDRLVVGLMLGGVAAYLLIGTPRLKARISNTSWLVLVVGANIVAVTMIPLDRMAAAFWKLQHDNLELADKHKPVIEKQIRDDARFGGIVVGVHTGRDVFLIVQGQMPSDDDVEDLLRKVRVTKPPVLILLSIEVGTNGYYHHRSIEVLPYPSTRKEGVRK